MTLNLDFKVTELL